MSIIRSTWLGGTVLAGSLLAAGVLAAQSQNPPAQQQQQQQQAQPGDKGKQGAGSMPMDSAGAAPSAEEQAAFKAFEAAPPSDPPKKNELGEAFLQKYPQSQYRGAV
jgi:hypothetical protein